MSKTVYLVNISRKTTTLHFPIGIGAIAKSLMLHKIPFEIIDLISVPYEKREDTFSHILNSIPQQSIFGFSIIAGNSQIIDVEKYATIVKHTNSKHLVVFGGPLPSAIPKLCLEKTMADYIITGEGEESFPTFLKNLNEKKNYHIPGLAFKDKDGTINITKGTRVKNLDLYNPIPYEKFNMDFYNGYLKRTGRCFEISGSRGCKGACKFCFRFSGPGLTARSGKSLFEEVKLVYDRYGINKFNFIDENFLQPQDNFCCFLDLLEREGISIKFRGQTRIDEIDEKFCEKLVKNGLISINFGVESADDSILERARKKFIVSDIEAKIKMLRSFGVEVYTSVIVGFPWETRESLRALKDFIQRNELQGYCTVNYLAPLPATELYNEAKDMGLIGDEWEYIQNMGYLYRDRRINMTSLDSDEIGYYYEEILKIGEPKTPKVSNDYKGILIDDSIY